MNDKELMGLAAKAAGIRYINPAEGYDGALGLVLESENGLHGGSWNPLTDDGDALRLAVEIAGNGWCFADLDAAYFEDKIPCWLDAKDPLTATRRAIVRAAAEIGKNMLTDK